MFDEVRDGSCARHLSNLPNNFSIHAFISLINTETSEILFLFRSSRVIGAASLIGCCLSVKIHKPATTKHRLRTASLLDWNVSDPDLSRADGK